ncbi:MAG: OmpA family protein [Eudoraea sp.]|nr:OmpA family protein [Eudoraea sp.]NNJ41042.1 OmpA family protein [Eudoraea sp.]
MFCQSQNLIKNPSFEQFGECPVKLGNLDQDVMHWSAPTIGSTDYFHSCSNYMGTPKNFNGVQEADFGSGYAGLYLYAPDDYREYLQASLTETLVKGERYELSFYISLAERSDFAIREFGVLFSDKPLKFETKKNLSKRVRYSAPANRYHYIKIPDKEFYRDTEDWVEVKTAFTALGTERYMTLGNFENNVGTLKTKRKRQAKQGAYYYLDLVSLTGPDSPITIARADSEEPPEPEKTYALDAEHTFKNVLFEFDRYQLSEAAMKEVKQVYGYLQQHPDFIITVHGHTDNVGTSGYNQELSENRCKAVTEYLLGLGLSASRVSWVGQGGGSPIASNDTEAGRQQNRRVVFVLSRQ